MLDVFVRTLDPTDVVDGFDCGNAAMNEYFHRYAKKNQGQLYGMTYVCVCPQVNAIIGYFTIATTTIPRAGMPEGLLKGLPKYQNIPAILLGRLAVDRKAQGKKIGEFLLSYALDVCLSMTKVCGARYVVTDAVESSIAFYRKYGFQEVHGSRDPQMTKMFLDLKVVRAATETRRREAIAN